MRTRTYIRPASQSDCAGIERFCLATGNAWPPENLEAMLLDQCLLQATRNRCLSAVVGLDLDLRAIVGPWSTKTTKGHDMLAAAERLAASYGMISVSAGPGGPGAKFFTDAGYRCANGELVRSIVRRTTRFGRRARETGTQLGIPGDYGPKHRLRLQPEATRLSSIGKDIYGRQQRMTPGASAAWKRMVRKAKQDDITIQPVSAFRSLDYQARLLRRKLEKGQSIKEILKVSAAPGFSEHHSGNAIDITTPGFDVLEEPFEKSPAFEWLSSHAGDFGFTLSYPRNNRHGVCYEPWHWCWTRSA